MYDELVKRLRICAKKDANCVICGKMGEGDCFDKIKTEAADAIENLEGQMFLMKKTAEWLNEKIPKWIPVTERLPEDGQKVLVLEPPYGESSRYYYSIVYFSTNLEKVDEYDFQGKNRSGFCSLDSEWGWCEHCKVVYWMPLPPLPEPPKESES